MLGSHVNLICISMTLNLVLEQINPIKASIFILICYSNSTEDARVVNDCFDRLESVIFSIK